MVQRPEHVDRHRLAREEEGLGLFANALLLASLVLIWAISWPIIKVGISEVPPIWFGFLRYIIATVLVFGILALTRGTERPARADWSLILVSGALQMAAYAALMGMALLILPPGRASVLAYSTPIWVVPLATWWLAERMSPVALGGVVVGMLGVITIASPSLISKEPHHLLAYLSLVGASVAWAISIVFVRGHRFTSSAFVLAPWQMLVAAILLLPCALFLEGAPPAIGRTGLLSLAFVGPISTGFAYWAAVETGRYFRASTMSMALLATPSLGIVISALTLGEKIDTLLIAGVAMVACGIWMSTIASRKERR